MIRLAIYSQDTKLQAFLVPTLGTEFSVIVEPDPDSVKGVLSRNQCDVLIIDFDTRYSTIENQLKFFDEIRHFPVPVVAMTDGERSSALELVQRGVYDYFDKPPCLPELKIILKRAYELSALKRELESTKSKLRTESQCDALTGTSARLRVTFDLIRRVADLKAFVLISGESGTGKELVARACHNLSQRAKLPFVPVSCGAIPETLIEAELFGHEKGAYTGAAGSREGYFEQAGEGTLFLDEIGELTLQTQVKLLRVLQEREFFRLGSAKRIPLRARVLFATHRDLGKMVEEGKFRQDLYYRVNVMRIHVAPLRDRTEDIPILAEHFLRKYSEMYEKPIECIDPSAMTLMLNYSWPGNVRELENIIQGAIINADDRITSSCLPDVLQQPDLLGVGDLLHGASFEEQLKDYRVKLALKAIQESNGNKTLAARTLNISRAYLHRLIREVGGEDETERLASGF